MDRSIPKRPDIQKQRHTTQLAFGNSQSVPRVLPRRHLVVREGLDRETLRRYPALRIRTSGSVLSPAKTMMPLAPKPKTVVHDARQIQSHEKLSEQFTSLASQAIRKSALDMSLPGTQSPALHKVLVRRKKYQKIRMIATRSLAVVLVLLITLGGLLFSQSYLKLNKVFKGTTGTVAALRPNVNPDLLKGEGSGRVNILLLGRGGGDHDGPDLTDSMMIASVDPVNYTTTLISIPRDLWVNVPNAGVMKINSAWETGEFSYYGGKIVTGSTNTAAITSGFNEVDKVVNQVFGINIDYNILLNFQAFQQAVNTVGGVTVNVPTPLIDPTMAWENNNNPILAQAGTQNFDGAQALLYVRSRETSSDFARAARQRAVLVAIKNKVDTLGTLSNPLKISGLINDFGDNIQTDLSLSNASRLYSILKKVDNSKINSVGLDAAPNQYVTTGNIDGQSVVLPIAGLFNYSAIQQYTRQLLIDPYIIKENAKILVLNGTDVPGTASSEVSILKSYGYNVIGDGNAPTNDWTQTTLIDLTKGKDPYTQNYLQQRFGVKASDQLPDASIQTNGADFVIILGSDELNTTQTQAY